MKFSYLFSLLTLLLISSCAKEFDDSMITEDDIIINAPVFVETGLFVLITGFSDIEDLNAKCTINHVVYTPDINGYLFIPSIFLNQTGQLIKIDAEGYMPAIFNVIPATDGNTRLKAKIVPSMPLKTFVASEGGILTINDSEYSIPALAIINGNGDEYLGTVNVHSYERLSLLYINLISSFSHNSIIGDDEKNYSLQTWGGHDIFLYDDVGNELFIKEEIEIQAQLDIRPIESNNVIPNELAIMRFDELTSTWKEDGSAILEGDKHAINISGFGHIRWCKKVEVKQAKVKYKSDIGSLEGLIVLVSVFDNKPIHVTNTNEEGYAFINVPVNKEYSIRTLSFCQGFSIIDNTVEEVPGPEDQILELEDIEVMEDFSGIQGRIVDCNGDAIPHGIIKSSDPFNNYFTADENGFFSSRGFFCDKRGVVYDPTNKKYSEEFSFESTSGPLTDLGDITACQ